MVGLIPLTVDALRRSVRRRRVALLASLALALGVALPARQAPGQSEAPSGVQRWVELTTQADLLYRQGRPAEALPLLREAFQIADRSFPEGDPRLLQTLRGFAVLLDSQAAYAEEEPLVRRILQTDEKNLGPTHPTVARDLHNLALLCLKRGSYAEAVTLYQRVLPLWEAAQGPESMDLAAVLNDLGWAFSMEGKFAEAEPLYRRGLNIYESKLGPDHPFVATTLNNLAEVYRRQGKYSQATALCERAVAIIEKARGPSHPDLAAALGNLANAYQEEGKLAQAEPLYQRALSILEAAGTNRPYLAAMLNNLGGLYVLEGKYAEAEPFLRRGLKLGEQTLGPRHPEVASGYNDLAFVCTYLGKYAEAETLYQRSLRIREESLGADHPRIAHPLTNLAELYRLEGRYAEAEPLFARAFAILFRDFQYHFTYMSEKERLAFQASVYGRFPEFYSFVHQQRETQPALIGQMYDMLLWQKGFVAGSVASMRRQLEASGDPEVLKLLDQLAAKRAQVASLLNAPPADRQAWRKQIDALESEANELEKTLVARSAAFAQQKKLEKVTWQQVRDALAPGEAAVEFARFRYYDGRKWSKSTQYVALVVTPETKDHPQYVVLGEEAQIEDRALIQFQEGVKASRGSVRLAPGKSAVAPGTEAYDLLWKPLQPLLAGRKRVYVSPDGVLNQLSLGLLPAPDGRLLTEEYDLRLLSSTKDLLREPVRPASDTAWLIGNPAFDLGEARQRAAVAGLGASRKPEAVEMAALTSNSRSRDQGSGILSSLPGTAVEIQAIDGMLRQNRWQVTSYTGDRALEESVKLARSPRLLHIATHGFFLPDQQLQERSRLGGVDLPAGWEDPMLRSGLLFAGAERSYSGAPPLPGLDDGVLTAYEATSLNLQGTELVVLSACNTGQGEVQNGEGVFGLRRALQEAGAQAVMMSLWSVPDRETQELMTLFYNKWLSGTEKHEALRQAQIEERAAVRERYGRDLPYYWGAFVLVGR